MTIQFTLPADIVVALQQFAAQKDVRYYLNGIHIELHADHAIVCATDGTILGFAHVLLAEELPPFTAPLSLVVPNPVLTGIKARGSRVVFEFGAARLVDPADADSTVRDVSVEQDGVRRAGQTIVARYPDVRQAVPRRVSGEAAQFSGALIARLWAATQALNPKAGRKNSHISPLIAHNGEGPALVSFNRDDFFGVIVPLRPDGATAPTAPPAWLIAPRPGDAAVEDAAAGLV